MFKFCPHCGTKNNGYKFCPGCGAPLDSESSAPSPAPSVVRERPSAPPPDLFGKPDEFIIRAGTLVSYIGDAPFIKIPEGVEIIGARAFFGKNILSVTIPQSVKGINIDAFACCYPLTEVYNCSALDIKLGDTSYGQVARLVKNVYTPTSGESKLKTQGDFVFFADGDNVLLVDYVGSDTTMRLPDGYCGKPYTIMRDGWFNRTFYRCRTKIKKIVFPSAVGDSVNSKVNDPDGGAGAVRGFTTVVGKNAFNGFSALIELEIPNGVTEIDEGAFSCCDSLLSVTLPESLEYVWPNSISGKRLTEVFNLSKMLVMKDEDVPEDIDEDDPKYDNLVTFDCDIFSGRSDSKLVRDGDYIYTDGAVPTLVVYTGHEHDLKLPAALGGKSYKIGDYAFCGCRELVRVEIPDGVVAIGSAPFDSCACIKSVSIPRTVKEIASGAFESFGGVEIVDASGCITVNANSRIKDKLCTGYSSKVRTSGEFMFIDDGKNIRLCGYFGNAVDVKTPDSYGGRHYVIDSHAFGYNKDIKSITFGAGVDEIWSDATVGCRDLEKVVIPRGVREMSDAFNGCSKLDEIYYLGSVLDWINIFENMNDRGTLYYNNFSYQPDHCFDLYCNGSLVTDVTMPAGIRADYAFCHCMSVKRVTFAAGTREIGTCVFADAVSLESVVIPEGVTEIGDTAFDGSGLRTVTLPSSLRNIGENSFNECRLTSAVVNTGASLLYMFPFCSELTSVRFNAVPRVFDEGVLQGTGLRTFAVPYGVTRIVTEAFGDCENLTSITIPDSVTAIESEAFRGCTALKTVALPRSCAIEEDSFPEWCTVTRR